LSRPVRARMDLAALRSNLAQVRRLAPDSQIIAVIKANAYGHGLLAIAHALTDVDALAVACVEEARQLRDAGIVMPIVLLEGFFSADELTEVIALGLEPVIHNAEQLAVLTAFSASGSIAIWLKIDTGMHRLGFSPQQAAEIHQQLSAMDVISSIRLFSHLACADDRGSGYTQQQGSTFQTVLNEIGGEASLANSAAIMAWPDLHYDWVRPGLMLYGISPLLDGCAVDDGLRPVMHLTTQLIAVHQFKRGDRVGYGGDWECPQDMTVGIAAIGYGDGYPRHAPTGTPILVDQQRTQLLGRVSMDMIAVDLRGLSVTVGAEVTLWGKGLPVEEIAACAMTIPYELVCGLAGRVAVEYVGGDMKSRCESEI